MKTISTTLFALLLTISFGFAQTNATDIEDIKTTFQTINNGGGYEIKEIDTGCGCGCGGIMAYYKNGELVKIVDYYGHSQSSEITEFYYKNGQLIFVYDELETFSFGESQDGDTAGFTEQKYEGRFYFVEGKLIKKDLQGNFEQYVSEEIEEVLLRISADNIMLLNNDVALNSPE